MKLGVSIDHIRELLNEEGQTPEGSNSTAPETSDKFIVGCLVRSLAEEHRDNPQAIVKGTTNADIEALMPDDQGNVDRAAEFPVRLEFLRGVEEKAFAIINLRDQPGYRPELIRAIVDVLRATAPTS